MKLILCGGGSGEQDYYANKKLNEIINHRKPLLYIPLAMDENEHPYDGCYIWIKKELSEVKLGEIEMVRSFEELTEKCFEDYCALFIGGGNVYKLLNGLKEKGIFGRMKDYIERDGVVLGSSAGAVIFGYDIDVVSSMDSNYVGLKDTKGFNVMNGISVFPHYGSIKSNLSEAENAARQQQFTNSILDYSNRIGDVIAIPEEDAIFVDDDRAEILGNKGFYYFSAGLAKIIEPNNGWSIKLSACRRVE